MTVRHSHHCCLTEDGAALIPRGQLIPRSVLGWKMGPAGPQSWVPQGDIGGSSVDEHALLAQHPRK
jgi:hypothetical protein